MNEKLPEAPAGVAPDVTCHFYSEGKWSREPSAVPRETSLTILVNGQVFVNIMCTPDKLNCLALGYLYAEGIIRSLDDVASLRICEDELEADVILSRPDFELPARRTITSGCGQGITYNAAAEQIVSDLTASPEEILALMKTMYQQQELFRHCGGIHASALCDRARIIAMAEDIGRHNTMDKIVGECLLRKIPVAGHILLTTGRISSEMLLKAARMGAPIVVSRGTPTERAIELGNQLGITVVGYVRSNRLSVFSTEARVAG